MSRADKKLHFPRTAYPKLETIRPKADVLCCAGPGRAEMKFHGSSIVDFDSARGGISLETEKTEGGTSSRLMLTRATLRDSGNYTCVPTGAISASVQVHVLNGKYSK
ncbi:hypothetical protein AND_009264 [Anopheles darlingi]|uniref:Ig-like domain-containing protein n=1 Tax=Anopheles darlingi TaxID=43151 RepID=W5J8B0_ANODA|nr:hypothetical protein AND_009264 [Anopheles darlingi]